MIQNSGDDKNEKKGDEDDAYKAGRQGNDDVLGTDTDAESDARERGKEDRIDSKESAKEEEERDVDNDDN